MALRVAVNGFGRIGRSVLRAAAKEQGIETIILTNGELIKEEQMELVLRYADVIRFSLDSFSAAPYSASLATAFTI